MLLTKDDLKNGEFAEIPERNKDFKPAAAYSYEVEAVDVPEAIFDFDEIEDESLEKLWQAIHNSAYASGEPTFVLDEDYEGQFVFQFDDKLLKKMLGDLGVMHVFADTACWQGVARGLAPLLRARGARHEAREQTLGQRPGHVRRAHEAAASNGKTQNTDPRQRGSKRARAPVNVRRTNGSRQVVATATEFDNLQGTLGAR